MKNVFKNVEKLVTDAKKPLETQGLSPNKISQLHADSQNVFNAIEKIKEKLQSINASVDLTKIEDLKKQLIKSSEGEIDYSNPKLLDENVLNELLKELEKLTNVTEKDLDKYNNLADNDEVEKIFEIRVLLKNAKLINDANKTDDINALNMVKENADQFALLANKINELRDLIPDENENENK